MHINRVFELSMMLDSDKFEEIFSQAYCGDDYSDEEEYTDHSMTSRGVTVKYRASQYKKKVKILADVFTMTNGDTTDTDKFLRKLEKRISEYFDSCYRLEDFTVSGLTLTTAIDVGNRENVVAYLKVLNRIGKVKGFSPAEFDGIDETDSFCLKGNSTATEFLIYDLEQVAAAQMGNIGEIPKYKGILRSEVRLTKAKAVREYSAAYSTVDQLVELSKASQDIFMNNFVRIIPFGAFHKKNEATEIIRGEVKDKVLRRHMLQLLTLIPKKKSLMLAQQAMSYRHPKELLLEFAKLNLSPISIAKRQEVNYLPILYEYIL